MRAWPLRLSVVLLLGGCGRYDDFKLPQPRGTPRQVRWRWVPASEPVLRQGAPGAFDSVDALNPSIVRRGALYWNFYSGWDGKTWRTGLATSSNGTDWEKRGVLFGPSGTGWEGGYLGANGAAAWRDGEWFAWYQAGSPPRIGLARSRNGTEWRKEPMPVLETGPRGAWDEYGVGDPYVLEAEGRFYMYFLGQDRARRQRIGLAVSADGKIWTKLRVNPILESGPDGAFDETGLGEPAVWSQFGQWWMLYTGRDRREWRRIGLASSGDGVLWKRVDGGPTIPAGSEWNSRVVCDPEVEVSDAGAVRVWFGGGNRPEPAENLNGQIGIGWLRPEVY